MVVGFKIPRICAAVGWSVDLLGPALRPPIDVALLKVQIVVGCWKGRCREGGGVDCPRKV